MGVISQSVRDPTSKEENLPLLKDTAKSKWKSFSKASSSPSSSLLYMQMKFVELICLYISVRDVEDTNSALAYKLDGIAVLQQ